MVGLLSVYSRILDSEALRRWYKDKLMGFILTKLARKSGRTDVDMWPAVTHVKVCMILTLSPYTKSEMLNYKSLDSYKNFVKGWVRKGQWKL